MAGMYSPSGPFMGIPEASGPYQAGSCKNAALLIYRSWELRWFAPGMPRNVPTDSGRSEK